MRPDVAEKFCPVDFQWNKKLYRHPYCFLLVKRERLKIQAGSQGKYKEEIFTITFVQLLFLTPSSCSRWRIIRRPLILNHFLSSGKNSYGKDMWLFLPTPFRIYCLYLLILSYNWDFGTGFSQFLLSNCGSNNIWQYFSYYTPWKVSEDFIFKRPFNQYNLPILFSNIKSTWDRYSSNIL